FAASLLVHCLLALSLGTVPLARAVVEHAEIIRVNQAVELFDEPRPGGSGERPAFEKVADPRAEKVATPHLGRQPAAPVPVADAHEVLMPTIPMQAARGLGPERVMFVPARQPEVVPQPLEIPRRAAPGDLKPVEIALDVPQLPPPEAMPREKPI